MKQPAVYILASGERGTLYVGVTSNLPVRVTQHKQNLVKGFTKKYSVHTLVWRELHETMESAILREKAIKAWKRALEAAVDRDGKRVLAGSLSRHPLSNIKFKMDSSFRWNDGVIDS